MNIIGDGQPAAPTGQPAPSAAPAEVAAPTPTAAAPTDQVNYQQPQGPKPVDPSVLAAFKQSGQPQAPASNPAAPADGNIIGNDPVVPPTTPPTTDPQPPTTDPNTNIYEQVRGAKLQDIIPEQYKNDPHLSRITDIEGLCKVAVDSQKFISQSVRIPGEDATEEDRAEFYKKLGRPEDAQGYEVDLTQDLKDKGMSIDADRSAKFKEAALKANLTAEQAKNLFEYYTAEEANVMLGSKVALQEQAAKTIDNLKGKWRSDYADNINLINANLDKFFPKEVQETLKAKGMFADQTFIESMLGLTKKVSGSNMFIEGGGPSELQQSELAQLEQKRRDLMVAPDRRQRKQEEFDINKRIAILKAEQNS